MSVRTSVSKRHVSGRKPGTGADLPSASGEPGKTFTFQIGWNPMPPGVERVGARVVFHFSDDTVNWSQKSLEEALSRARVPPPATLGTGKCRVIVRTALAKMAVKAAQMNHFADGRNETHELTEQPIVIEPRDAEFERLLSEADPILRLDRAMMIAERIRNHLAYAAQMPLPLTGVCASREFLIPFQMGCDAARYAPPVPSVLSDIKQNWYRKLDAAYVRTRQLIDRLTPDEPLARAISLVGEAIWTSDAEERFFYAWRALEVIGNSDLRFASKQLTEGNSRPAQPYIAHNVGALLGKGQVKIDPVQLVEVSIEVRAPDVKPNPAKDYYDLRNAIAHGDVSVEKHLTILKHSGEILTLAYRLTEGVLAERNLGFS